MASCYFCAAPLRPGDGVRRQVLTSQSTRTYVSSRAGFSYGQSYGLRTLCPACAAQMDRQQEGEGGRVFLSCIAAFLGWFLMLRVPEGGVPTSLLVFFLLFGGPGWVTYLLLKSIHNADEAAQGAQLGRSDETSGGGAMPAAATALPSSSGPIFQAVNAVGFSPDFQRVMQELRNDLSDFGISLSACYAMTDSPEDMKRLFDSLLVSFPVTQFPFEDAWRGAIYRQSVERFFAALGRSHDDLRQASQEGGGELLPKALDPLFQLFPIREEESLSDYMARLNDVVDHLNSVMTDQQAETAA